MSTETIKPLAGKDIATLTNVELVTEISRLLSTLESLQRENEELRRDLSHEASHRQKLQNALAYWMPGVTEEIEISTNGRCGDDALLLVGSEGAFEDKCWGNEVLARAEAAEAEVKREAELATHMANDCNEAQARMKVLEVALKPFAEEEPDHMDISEDNEIVTPHLDLVYGDFRRARTALASTGGEHHADK